jgi:hypothetical protein
MIADRVRILLVTIWVGSLWTVGYLVAPVLFATLADRILAGTIAASMFRVEAWLSIVCGVSLILLQGLRPVSTKVRTNKVWVVLIASILAFTVAGHFGLQPLMAELRAAAPGGILDGAAKEKFGILHGVASSIYLFQSLLAGLLMFRCTGTAPAGE